MFGFSCEKGEEWGAGDDRERALCYLRAVRESDAGMAWGSLVHVLLEHAMRGSRQNRAHLARLANWLTMGQQELRRVVPEALDTVERVMNSGFWRHAQSALERQVEVPFAVRAGAGETTTILHRVIDRVFLQAEGWILVDYKTDRIEMDALERQSACGASKLRRRSMGAVDGRQRLTCGAVQCPSQGAEPLLVRCRSASRVRLSWTY